jgi:hypothetical protein
MAYAVTSNRLVEFTGRSPALGAATEIILDFGKGPYPAKRATIQRVHLVRISGAAANYTPRIVSATGAAAGSIDQEFASTILAVGVPLDATNIQGYCSTDALGNLYLVIAPDAGADNVFDYRIWCEVSL